MTSTATVFIAALYTETNTFSSFPTGRENFEETLLFHGDGSSHPEMLIAGILDCWRNKAEGLGHEVAEGLCAMAWPAGKVVRNVYEEYRDGILDKLQHAKPGDLVLLLLHGAMVADGYDDTEGDLLARARTLVGPDVTIGVELDLHCHLTETMVENSDLIVIYQEYPHIDEITRAAELFDLAEQVRLGAIHPVMAMFDCRMIGLWGTFEEPMRGFVDQMRAASRQDGVIDVALAHGFPWADVEAVGAKVLALTHDSPQLAETVARHFGEKFFRLREQVGQRYLSIEDGLDVACAAEDGPVVLADVGDNSGGGAPNDSTFVLRRVLERGITNVALSSLWDPVAVRICREAGVGARLFLRMGGKCGPDSGDPIDLEVEVMKINPDAVTILADGVYPMGTAVWVRGAGVDIILNTIRTQTCDPGVFRGVGIDPMTRDILIVKSAHHFVAGFSPIAKRTVHLSSPGTVSVKFASIPLTKRTVPYWPKYADPFGVEEIATL